MKRDVHEKIVLLDVKLALFLLNRNGLKECDMARFWR